MPDLQEKTRALTAAERMKAYRLRNRDLILERERLRDRERGTEKKRSQRTRQRENPRTPTFIGVDGEGYTDDAGIHHYVMLAASTGEVLEQWRGDGISTQDAFEYLVELRRAHKGAELVSFFFSYDVNMILKDLSRDDIEMLHRTGKTEWRADDDTRYVIEFIKTKIFQVTKTEWIHRQNKYRPVARVKVWDVFGFFQASFVKALSEWKVIDGKEAEFIANMKSKRGEFTPGERKTIRKYCLSECRQLVALMDKLAETLWSAGIPLRHWHGAGAIAAAMMEQNGMRNYLPEEGEYKRGLYDAIMGSYFGGRTETYGTGTAPGPVYTFDINSAYPAALVNAPDLNAGRWRRTRTFDPAAFGIWHIKYDAPGRIAPFPHRLDKSIYWPENGEGWYHTVEVAAARDWDYPIDILDGYIWEPLNPEERPWKWIAEIYRARQVYKETGDPRNVPLKLGLNSMYGKLAQGIGAAGRKPPYQSYVLAGYVTAYCRAMMLRALQRCEHPVSVATDGLFTLDKLDLEIGPGLGQWERKGPYTNVLIVQPGFMMAQEKAGLQRSRGTPRNTVSYDVFFDAWKKDGLAAKVITSDTRFIGMGKALRASDFRATWRLWKTEPREFSFYPSRKHPNCPDKEYPWCPLIPVRFDAGHMSEPYTPKQWISDVDPGADPDRIGADEDFDQPDYGG